MAIGLCVLGLILTVWALGWTDEALKMIDYKERLNEQGVQSNYLNSLSDIVVANENNEYLDLINKYKSDVTINPENTAFTQQDYKSEWISIKNAIPTPGLGFIHNNGDRLDAKDELLIEWEYYAWNEVAPKNPTSILPIHKPCNRTIEADLSISYVNCETFITTDNQPLFISFFENGNAAQWWGFTIVEIRNKSDETLEHRFFLWGSKKNDFSLDPVVHQSYTYWLLQEQDRTNLYITDASWNLNLDGITTTSYETLSQGEYSVYFQNINKFGLKSDRIKAWYLSIIPPEGALQDFDFIDITNPVTSISTNIVGWYVSINYKENARIRINNPGNYEYDILSIVGWVNKTGNEFTVDLLDEGDNIFNIQIKDQAGNILDNKPLIVTVDTVPPSITSFWIDTSYIDQPTTDDAIAMKRFLWKIHVNDNIDFSWVSGWNKTPFVLRAIDNVSLSGLTVQYWVLQNGTFNPVEDFTWSDGNYRFNIDTSFKANDGELVVFARAIDWFWNISEATPVDFYVNRRAEVPTILTNAGQDIITNSTSLNVDLQLEDDIVKVLYQWFNLADYEPFSTSFSPTIPLQLWDKNYIFNTIDLLGNRSDDWDLAVLKNPSPRDGLYGEDSTIQFEGWVTTNKINLQRVTEDGSAWEIFSR